VIFTIYITNSYVKINKNKNLSGKIEVWAYGAYYDYLKDRAVEFNEKYPAVNVNIKNIEESEIEKVLMNKNLEDTSTLPDLALLNSTTLQQCLVDNNILNSMTSTVNGFANVFSEGRLNEVKRNEQFYGMPLDGRPVVMYYNEAYLNEAGVKSETIKTWNDLIEAGKKLYAYSKESRKILYIDKQGEIELTKTLLYQLGVGENIVTEDEKNKILMVKELLDKFKKENIIEVVNTKSELQKSSIVFGSIDKLDFIKNQELNKWNFTLLPSFEAGGNNFVSLEGNNLVLSNNKNEKVSLEFMVYALTNDKALIKLMEDRNVFPVFIPCYSNKKFEEKLTILGNNKYWATLNNIQLNEKKVKNVYNVNQLVKELSLQ
jgi:multiple sugar transport system substrate-binding protein